MKKELRDLVEAAERARNLLVTILAPEMYGKTPQRYIEKRHIELCTTIDRAKSALKREDKKYLVSAGTFRTNSDLRGKRVRYACHAPKQDWRERFRLKRLLFRDNYEAALMEKFVTAEISAAEKRGYDTAMAEVKQAEPEILAKEFQRGIEAEGGRARGIYNAAKNYMSVFKRPQSGDSVELLAVEKLLFALKSCEVA